MDYSLFETKIDKTYSFEDIKEITPKVSFVRS